MWQKKSSQDAEIVSSNTAKRITMNFLYDEVSKEQLTYGWNVGFAKNRTPKQMQGLQERLNRFNSFFCHHPQR